MAQEWPKDDQGSNPRARSLRAIWVDTVLDHFGEHQDCDSSCAHASVEESAAYSAWQDFQTALAEGGWTVTLGRG